MKKYQKPAMLALSLSANDNLCGTCSYSTRENKDSLYVVGLIPEVDWVDGNNDGVIGPGESNLFANQLDTCVIDYGEYCKFTAADEIGSQTVFTS